MAGYIETVKTIDTILWKMGYKDGQDYKWSDRDRVLTFKSDDVRKEVAAKIPAKMIHAQYPRTIELEDKGLKDSLFEVKDSLGQKFIISAKNFDSALKKVKDMKLTDSDKLVKLAEEFVMKGSILSSVVNGYTPVSGDGDLGRKIDEFYRIFTQLNQQLKSESSKKTVSTSYNDDNQTERFLDKGRELLNKLAFSLTHPDGWFKSKFGDYTSTGRKFEQMSKILLTSTVNYLNGVKGR